MSDTLEERAGIIPSGHYNSMINSPSAPKRVQEAFQFFSKEILQPMQAQLKTSVWIAGGALRDFFSNKNSFSDLDFFFCGEDERRRGLYFFRDVAREKPVLDSPNATKLEIKPEYRQLLRTQYVDLVKIPAASPLETIARFNFTVCAAAIDSAKFYYHPNFFFDLPAKSLRFNSIPTKAAILPFFQKYVRKGFTMARKDLALLAEAIALMEDFEIPDTDLSGYRAIDGFPAKIAGMNLGEDPDIPF